MLAYEESYVSGVQQAMGSMLDYAVNVRGADIRLYYGRFLHSRFPALLERGCPGIFIGRSGIEMAIELLGEPPVPAARQMLYPGREYWTGWALAYYQWRSGRSLPDIERLVPIDQVEQLYHPFHEMDISSFCMRMDELCSAAQPLTNLQQLRMQAQLSQRQLADLAGMPVRTLQQYEQRQKSINRDRAEYVVSLARVLCCEPSDLLEKSCEGLLEYEAVKLPSA